MDPSARANLLSAPIRYLWKVWVSSYLIHPSWFWSKWFHDFSKLVSNHPGTSAGLSLWAASRIVPALSLASSFMRSFCPVLWPDGVLPSLEYLENTLSMISSSSAPLYPERCISPCWSLASFLPNESETSVSLMAPARETPKRATITNFMIFKCINYKYYY